MNLGDLTKLISDPAERVIVVEEGKPTVVVMGLEAYRALRRERQEAPARPVFSPQPKAEEATMDRVNAELEADRLRVKDLAAKLAMEAERPEVRLAGAPEDYSQIRLEDLPL